MNLQICGPKCSLCALIISVWGIIQLVLMGIFFYIHSVALIEDLPVGEKIESAAQFYSDVNAAYSQNAYNCWIAACIYVITLLFSAQQFHANRRSASAAN